MTTKQIPRFSPVQRLFHLCLMLSFLTQSATGLARMFIETPWGRALAGVFGGYEASLELHKAVGLFMIALFVAHVLYVLLAVRASKWLGKDSLVPGTHDVRQFGKHVGWFLGLCKEPSFGRWSYWEKFDYWAVFWGMVIIGGTGLMLYNPVLTSRSFEGWTLNLAMWVHRIEALLAIGHVFVIHFFVAHLRRRNFPMDTVIFTGQTDAEHMARERGPWVQEVEARTGLVEDRPSPLVTTAAYALGFGVVACGLFLLIGAVSNLCAITW